MTRQPDLKILYVEDDPGSYEPAVPYLREVWSPQTQHVRSYEAAFAILDSDEFRPDMAFHDCMPLLREDSEHGSEAAGRQLYRLLIDEGIPVVVLSGISREELIREEPYRAAPPIAWFEKPLKWIGDGNTCEQLDAAIEAFREWKANR